MNTFLIISGISAAVFIGGAFISQKVTQGRTSWRWPLFLLGALYDRVMGFTHR